LSVFNRDEEDGLARGAKAVVALPERGGDSQRSAAARLDEAAGLASAIGVDVVDRIAFKLRQPKPATLFGAGQVESIATAARMAEAELVIVDAALTPVQQQNLEKAFDAKVIDGAVNGAGWLAQRYGSLLRRTQTGHVQNYALGMAAGLVVVLVAFLVFRP